jgi:hypothetical protein
LDLQYPGDFQIVRMFVPAVPGFEEADILLLMLLVFSNGGDT